MRIKAFFLLFVFFQIYLADAQSTFREFRTLEQRVKYITPDSLKYFSQTIDTTKTIGRAMKYWSSGRADYWQSNYPKAYIQLEKAAGLMESLKNPNLLAEIYLDLAASLSVVDQNGKALSYLLDAKSIFEKTGNSEQVSRVGISLGEMYRKIGDFEDAYEILYKSKNIAANHSYNHARCLNRLAAVHSESGSRDSSLYYSFQALEIAEGLNDPDLIAISENEIGYIYRINRQFKKALPRFKRADSLWKSVGMLRYAANSMHHISVVYGTINEIDKSLEVTHEAYSLIKDRNWYQLEANLLEDLRNLQNQLNRPDSASYYEQKRLQAIIDWKDEQYAVNTSMVQVLFTQKQNEQTINEQKIRLQKEALEKEAINRELTFLLITIILIVLILLIIFIYAYNQRKLKIKLARENDKKELKNKQLSDAITTNKALVQEISHRVKNNLAVLSGLLRMQATRSENDQVTKELNDSILRIESIATIHKKLYDKRTDAKVDLKEALLELSENVLTSMGRDSGECLTVDLEECEIEIAQAVTFCLIINEVITNSCKYGAVSPNEPLSIKLSNSEDGITCKISDHGPGFNFEEIKEKTNSLGVYLINLLAKQLKATISWNKTKENFIFKIHLNKDE